MKTVFIVDDSSTARVSIDFALTDAGYKVEQAEDGAQGLEKIKSYPGDIALFIFDINMPNMDGYTLTKKVRELAAFAFTPILFLTTESSESKIQQGKEAGASGWIVKPFEPEKLISTVNRFIGD